MRDVAASEPVPHLTAERFGAFITSPEQRSAAQEAVVAYSDLLINELQQADVIVIGLPMYNFGVPSQLKAYFDHIARAGVTFKYTEQGPVGLLTGKRAVVFRRGGVYAGTPLDTQTAYVRDFLRFVGITDVEFARKAWRSVHKAKKQVWPRPASRLQGWRRESCGEHEETKVKTRDLTHIIESMATSDGAGVKLRRSLGSQRGLHVDSNT